MFKYNKNFAIMTLVIYMESIEKKRFFSIFDKLFFKGLLSILVYYFIFYGFSHILAIIFMPYLKYVKASEQLISALYNLIIYLTLGISLFLINKDTLKEDFKNIKDTHIFARNAFIGIFIMYIATIVSGLIQQRIISGVSQNESSINSMFKDNIAFCFMYPSTILLAPFVEEMIFRKSAFNVFKNKIVALIITTIVFGSMHITSTYPYLLEHYDAVKAFFYTLAYGIPYFTMGLTFGLCYIFNEQNYYSSLILHMVNNFVASTLSIIILINII